MNLITYIKETYTPGGTPKRYLIWVCFMLMSQLFSSILPNPLFHQFQLNLVTFLFFSVCSIVLIVLTIKKEDNQILASFYLYIVGLILSVLTITQGITSISGIIFLLLWTVALLVAERREYISFDYVIVFMVLMVISAFIILISTPYFSSISSASNQYVLWVGTILSIINLYLVYVDFGLERNFYKEFRNLYSDLEKLNVKMSEILSSEGELEHLLSLVSKECIPLLGIEDCVIYLFNEKTQRLRQVAAYGNKFQNNEVVNPIELRVNEGIVGKCFYSGEPIWVHETKARKDYIVDDLERRSELAVPIISNGKTVGVIDSEHSMKGFFKERHLQAFTIIATFCGIKITEYESRASIELAKIAQEEVDHYKELDEFKHRFIANISHDLKTPLSLIKGPAVQIKQISTDLKVKDLTNYIIKNADHLLRVVNQLLQLNRVVEGLNQLYLEQVDIEQLITKIKEQYEGLAIEKNIMFITDCEPVCMITDSFRLEQIIHNILHNSFRYTHKGGKIELVCTVDDDKLVIRISDNGPGIPFEIQDRIFDRFFKADINNHEGTGIGLSLVKEYLTSLGGSVNLISHENKGTTFNISIPIKQKINEIKSVDSLISNDTVYSENLKPILLVVEDHADLNNFICSYFEDDFLCISTFDGEDALKKINLNIPDVIISDLMMPKLDGMSLVSKVRQNDKTAHIPIVILSAKDQLNNRIELYELGVENYLTKPFDITELKAVVDGILAQRRKMMNTFYQQLNFSSNSNLSDRTFEFSSVVRETIDYVLENIDDSELNVATLCKAIGVGRNKIQREIKSAVGLTPVEFIRSLRLNEAKKRLQDHKVNISEVAFSVGFNNLSYFSRSFKTEFGMLPSEWQEQHKNV